MHRHTVTGEAILLAAPALKSVRRIVRSTHERLDGGGYPDGLEGDRSRSVQASSPSATPSTR